MAPTCLFSPHDTKYDFNLASGPGSPRGRKQSWRENTAEPRATKQSPPPPVLACPPPTHSSSPPGRTLSTGSYRRIWVTGALEPPKASRRSTKGRGDSRGEREVPGEARKTLSFSGRTAGHRRHKQLSAPSRFVSVARSCLSLDHTSSRASKD